MELSSQKPQAWSLMAKRRSRNQLMGGRRRNSARAKWAIAAAGCVWVRPWSPVAFSMAETHCGAPRRHAPNDLVYRGRARDAICGDKRPGRWVGAGFVALGVFGFFEGDDAHGDSKRQSKGSLNRGRRRKNDPDDALKRLLLEGPAEDDSIRRTISDWWENLPLVGQSESRRKRRQREEVPEHGEADSIRRSISEWFENLSLPGQSDSKRKRRREHDEEQSPASGEDAESGIFNILASVKTSVVAAVMGTGRAEENKAQEEAKKEPKESLAQFLPEFPAPTGLFSQENSDPDASEAKVASTEKEEESEDWWQNAQAALGMTQKDEEPEQAKLEEEQPVEEEKTIKEEETPAEEEEIVATSEALEEEEEKQVEQKEEEEVKAEESEEAPAEEQQEERPPPEAPGMEDANLIVRVDIEPKRQKVSKGAKAIENLMSRPDREVLEAMAQEGWEVEVVDESKGLYMLSLPPVLYEVMGTSVSIPAPRFLTKLRDSRGRTSKFKERLEGDLVLQNGEGIFTLQLGFPFRTKLCISAAGWTRAKVGSEGDEILSSNFVEVGIQLPKVPGLTNIMEYFVKNYGTQSTQECTDALARAAERLPETPLQSIEDTMKEFLKPLTDPEGKEKKLVESRPGRPPT